MSFLSYLKDGISLGSIYAIIALGYTMVYGIAKMLNFAHGDVIMVGAYVILTAVTRGGMSPVLAVGLSVIFCTVIGVVIEKVAYSPLRKASSNLAVLITAIGVSYLLQNLALLIFGADAKSFVTVVDVPSVTHKALATLFRFIRGACPKFSCDISLIEPICDILNFLGTSS